jgi:hypothetical protein
MIPSFKPVWEEGYFFGSVAVRNPSQVLTFLLFVDDNILTENHKPLPFLVGRPINYDSLAHQFKILTTSKS